MCLAVPGKVTKITHDDASMRTGIVAFGGIHKDVCLAFLPGVRVGDYVIVHAGFAISRIDEEEAVATLALLEEMGGIGELTGENTAPRGKDGDAIR
jgi:hydrogenase expression/formation protein HypC